MKNILIAITSVLMVCTVWSQETTYDVIDLKDCNCLGIDGEPELYIGDDLFNLINGGAELYHEYGFVEVLAATIQVEADVRFKVEVYDMGSPESAWGIYSITATSNAKEFDAGQAGRKGEGYAQFIKGKYMLYVYFEPESESALHGLSYCLTNNIQSTFLQPELITSLQKTEEKPDRLVYFKGNLGLSALYNFHYKDIFGYEEGAAAIYPDYKVFLLRYQDEEQCLGNFNSSRDFFLKSSKYHDQVIEENSLQMLDRKEQQIDVYYERDFISIRISSEGDSGN